MNARIIAAAVVIAAAVGLGLFVFHGKETTSTRKEAEAVEKHEEEKSEVQLTAEQAEKAGIETDTVAPATIREVISLYGTVAANAERVRDVAARFPGTLRSVVKKVGDPVKQGDALATVESNESLQTYSVQSPLSGVITARNANPGEQTGDKVLFSVADLSAVWVEVSLFPRDAAKIHGGQEVRVKSPDGGTSGSGKIVYVAPLGTTVSQTRTARVLLDNSTGQWAPGLYVTAEVTLGEKQAPVAVHVEAIQIVDGHDTVFVKTAKGFERRYVTLGKSDSEFAEVTDGISAGESYVAKNSFILKAEMGKAEAGHDED